MARLLIEPLGLHWLYDEEPGADLCAHAGIRLTLEGRVLFETPPDVSAYAVSTAALHLLRSLEQNFRRHEGPTGEGWGSQAIPCCGHLMVVDETSRAVVNCGCPNGLDWTISHVDGLVRIAMPDGEMVEVGERDWRAAVAEFSAAVRRFYFASPRQPPPEDAEWHAAFVSEWNDRHEAAR